jgi:exonuclease VII small subunit
MSVADKESSGSGINRHELDLLVANIIPTSRYFEVRFDHLQEQVNDLKQGQKDIQSDIDRRFGELKVDIDKRFEQVDKRFEQVDKRFEQMELRLDQINMKLDTIISRFDVKIDSGLRENRLMSMRLFSFAMIFSAISMAGLLGRMLGLF